MSVSTGRRGSKRVLVQVASTLSNQSISLVRQETKYTTIAIHGSIRSMQSSLLRKMSSMIHITYYSSVLCTFASRGPNKRFFVNSSSSFLCDENLPIQIYNAISLGRLNYTKSWAWQQTLLSKRLAHRRTRSSSQPDTDCLLLLEHAPVYTLGRGSDESHILVLDSDQRQPLSRQGGSARLTIDRQADSLAHKLPLSQAIHHLSNLATPVYAPNGVPIYRVERGGEVTFHGPSQLVVYPLLDLTCSPFQKDLHWYLRQVEQVVIETLSHYNIHGQRDDENTGVWVDDEKVAAVGISSSRWITTHGFALNVDPNLDYFDTSVILPCGIEDKGVTSMAKILNTRGERVPSLPEVAQAVLHSFEQVFGVHNLKECDTPSF